MTCSNCQAASQLALCESCLTSFRSDLAVAEWLRDELLTTLTRQAKTTAAGRRAPGNSQPLPFNIAASEAADELETALADCAEDLAGHQMMNRDPLEWLQRFSGRLRIAANASLWCEILRAAVEQGERAVDKPCPRSRYAAPCDVAGCEGEWWTLPAAADLPVRDWLSCSCCGIVLSWSALEQRLVQQLELEIYPATRVAELASAATGRRVTRDQVNALARRRRDPLVPAEVRDDVRLYRLADVLERLPKSRVA